MPEACESANEGLGRGYDNIKGEKDSLQRDGGGIKQRVILAAKWLRSENRGEY